MKKNPRKKSALRTATPTEPEFSIAYITITIPAGGFRPLGSVMGINANLMQGSTLSDPPIGTNPNLKIVSNSIRITEPPGENFPMTLVFELVAEEYLLIGIAFSRKDAGPREDGQGQEEFPSITVESRMTNIFGQPKRPYRALTVVDKRRPENIGKRFEYALLVQRISTGEMGVIDPDIENQAGEDPAVSRARPIPTAAEK